jgi:threonine/homoserine/homoserine lactone efflux protein
VVHGPGQQSHGAERAAFQVIVHALLTGVICGFVASVPVAGPAAALVLERALERRPHEAWWIALGSAVPEGVYAFLACLGIGLASAQLPSLVSASHAAAGLFLIAAGAWLVRKAPVVARPSRAEAGRKSGLAVGVAVTAFNPTILLSWSAAVAALHSVGLLQMVGRVAAPFAVGVSAGICAWYALLIRLAGGVRNRIRAATVAAIVRSIGTALVVAGVVVALRAVLGPSRG